MNNCPVIAIMFALTLSINGLSAADPPQPPKLPTVMPPEKFEALKQLAGKWEGTRHSPHGEMPATVEYQLTSAGTVLTEKLFPGQPDEMLSLYHGDRDDVLMTHYCALGNQPRMKLAKTDDPKVLKFVYLDGTSMKSVEDPHMHQLTMTLVEQDQLQHEWVFFAGGTQQFVVRLDLERSRSSE